jgi:hypothetical protein
MEEQIKLQEEIIEKTDINIVTCGDCSTVILHKRGLEEIKCHDCGFESDPCDFPDLYHSGLTINK